MKVLIFADSHGYNMAMAFAVDREEPDAVIHLGDHAEDAREIERVSNLSVWCSPTTALPHACLPVRWWIRFRCDGSHAG